MLKYWSKVWWSLIELKNILMVYFSCYLCCALSLWNVTAQLQRLCNYLCNNFLWFNKFGFELFAPWISARIFPSLLTNFQFFFAPTNRCWYLHPLWKSSKFSIFSMKICNMVLWRKDIIFWSKIFENET